MSWVTNPQTMEALMYPASFLSSSAGGSCWSIAEERSSMWTKEENKKFERALALYDEKTPDRWKKVAELIPGKSVWDVIKQYKELEEDVSVIEAGLSPNPCSFSLEWVDYKSFGCDSPGKKSSSSSSSSSMAARPPDQQERRKGVPWTEEEHRRFLLGLEKHGKGDWRSISRNFVMSKTPTQVASHAQKYFLRHLSVGKDVKKRPSIHDITTPNLLNKPPSPPPAPDHYCNRSIPQFDHSIRSLLLHWGRTL